MFGLEWIDDILMTMNTANYSAYVFLRNSKGFSLIETSVAIGASMIMMLGLATMLNSSQKAIQWQEDKLGVLGSQTEILALLRDETACTATLAGQTITDQAPVVLGSYRGGYNISSRVTIHNLYTTNISAVPNAPGVFVADIIGQFKSIAGNTIYKPVNVKVYYTQSAGNVLTTCSGDGFTFIPSANNSAASPPTGVPYNNIYPGPCPSGTTGQNYYWVSQFCATGGSSHCTTSTGWSSVRPTCRYAGRTCRGNLVFSQCN